MKPTASFRSSVVAVFASAIVAALIGCSGSASREVYQQRMAGEIRVLEDQLYEADYQNRVLHDQLERCRVKTKTGRSVPNRDSGTIQPDHSSPSPESSLPSPIPDPNANDTPPSAHPSPDPLQLDDVLETEQLELPLVDPGQPIDPEALSVPVPTPVPDPESDRPSGSDSAEPDAELPPPGLPQPPGKEDISVPPLVPGEVLPPPRGGREEESELPGRIELPDSVSGPAGVPENLRIHSGFTTGITGSGKQNEMTIMVLVTDHAGRPVDLARFDIDADLSIVLVDPERQPSAARIGRWDFSADQIAELVRNRPISGLAVPVQWHGDRPAGDQVIVHARLRGEQDELRCERKVHVAKQRSIAEWTPRGDDGRR